MPRDALNLFYEEPDADRWVTFDRYPRKVLRRIIRGKPRVWGQQRVFVNLCAGLDRLGVPYRVNDYHHARTHPDELVGVVGKPFVLDKLGGSNPILFGASVFCHPCEDPRLLDRLPIRKVLVPGEWMRAMWAPYYGDAVRAWPVGIDTDLWRPRGRAVEFDVLLYDKVRWEHERYEASLIAPIRARLRQLGVSVREIRYGAYREEEFRDLLQQCRAMVFLCEHETQGIAYQQALSCDVPLLAWDRGGYWQDPSFYPDAVKFAPVSSVPYWDERCGLTFADADACAEQLPSFWTAVERKGFAPRQFVLDTLTLERRAQEYLDLYDALAYTAPGRRSAGLPRTAEASFIS